MYHIDILNSKLFSMLSDYGIENTAFRLAIVFLFLSFPDFSQPVHITGRVVNEKMEAVERVNVTLKYIAGGRIIAFALTAENGTFELIRDLAGIHRDSLELSFT